MVTPGTPRLLQPEQISSPGTFAMKVVIPGVWLGIWAWCTTNLFSPHPTVWGSGDPPDWAKWVFVAGLFLGIWIFSRLAIPLKRITLHSDHLVVSNFLREIVIPMGDVLRVGVAPSWQINDTPVGFIELRRDSGFGTRLSFYPRSQDAYDFLNDVVTTWQAQHAPKSGNAP